MALIPSSRYPSQVDADGAYPLGKARNSGSYQDGTGTPLERDWVNDLWGFQQALLAAAEITPSGTPDQVGASQYLESLEAVIAAAVGVAAMKYAHCSPVGTSELSGNSFQLLLQSQNGGFSIESDYRLRVPSEGRYFMVVTTRVRSASTSNPATIGVGLRNSGYSGTTRWSADTNHRVNIAHLSVRNMIVSEPDPLDYIAVIAETSTVLTIDSANLFVLKVS